MAKKSKTTIKLDPTDSALVLKQDGTMQVIIPVEDDDKLVEPSTYTISGIAALIATENKEFFDLLDRVLLEYGKDIIEDEEKNKTIQ